jgi:hypothetical protein
VQSSVNVQGVSTETTSVIDLLPLTATGLSNSPLAPPEVQLDPGVAVQESVKACPNATV